MNPREILAETVRSLHEGRDIHDKLRALEPIVGLMDSISELPTEYSDAFRAYVQWNHNVLAGMASSRYNLKPKAQFQTGESLDEINRFMREGDQRIITTNLSPTLHNELYTQRGGTWMKYGSAGMHTTTAANVRDEAARSVASVTYGQTGYLLQRHVHGPGLIFTQFDEQLLEMLMSPE